MLEIAFLAMEVLPQVPVGGVKQTQGKLRKQSGEPQGRGERREGGEFNGKSAGGLGWMVVAFSGRLLVSGWNLHTKAAFDLKRSPNILFHYEGMPFTRTFPSRVPGARTPTLCTYGLHVH
ncbi:endonuclease V [Pseudomonas chlororaphis subsp. aurantiaca]|nr:endonuclease V [Pseudomonas chlororaphis subsp. aurantiaca]